MADIRYLKQGSTTYGLIANKAIADGDGNTISSTYLKLSGGTMTGPIKWTDSNAIPRFSSSPTYLVGIDAFSSGGTMKWYEASQTTVGSATTASKLGTATVGNSARPVYINAGVPTVTNPGEAFLSWGGQNLAATNGPLDAALINTLGGDRFAFIPASCTTVEYSTDGGATWVDYGLTDNQKVALFAPGIGYGCYLGKHASAGTGTANDMLRVTVDTYDGTNRVYSIIRKFVMYGTSYGASDPTWSCQVRTTANVLNNVDTWTDVFTDVKWGGWSGINIVQTNVTIGANNPTYTTNTQYRQFRLIFKQTGARAEYYPSSAISYISGYGGVGWKNPSSMSKYNSIYSYDSVQNAFFPAAVRANTNLLGPLNYGTCSTAGGTAAKVVSCDNFSLIIGARISVKFTYANTATGNVTLNVNSTGAKSVARRGYSNTWIYSNYRWDANTILSFIYDGTCWVEDGVQTYLPNLYSYGSRATTANRSNRNGGLEYILATPSMTTGKPPADSHIIHMNWDNDTTYAAQLAVTHGASTGDAGRVFSRGQMNTSGWSAPWCELPRWPVTSAPTDGQVIISDASTGEGLIKGVNKLDFIDTTLPYISYVMGENIVVFHNMDSDFSTLTSFDATWSSRTDFSTAMRQSIPVYSSGIIIAQGTLYTHAFDGDLDIWEILLPTSVSINGMKAKGVIGTLTYSSDDPGWYLDNWGVIRDTSSFTSITLGESYSEGTLTIYGASIYSADVKYQGAYSGNAIYLPQPSTRNETNYIVAKNTSSAVGSVNRPVYVDSLGHVKPGHAIFKGTCDTAAATTAKVVDCEDFLPTDLVTGAIIFVTFTNTNSGAVASLTLNVNNTGAKNLKYLANANVSSLPAPTYIKANMTYRFVYDGSNWIMDVYYNTNDSANNVRTYYGNRVAEQTITPYMLMLLSANDQYIPYTADTSYTNYTKKPNTTPFNPFGGLYLMYANITYNAGTRMGHNNSVYTQHSLMDCRYAFNVNSSGTAGTTALDSTKPIYIKAMYDFTTSLATLVGDSDSSNYLERSSIVQALPTSNPNTDGNFYIYIYVGGAYDKYRLSFELFNPVYAWNELVGDIAPFTGSPYGGEGTFTAYFNAVGNTWHYYKVGKMVTVWGAISQASSMYSGGVSGLPCPADGDQVVSATCSGQSYILSSLTISLTDGATVFHPKQMSYSSVAGTSITPMDSEGMIWYTIGNTTEIRFTYLAAY